MLASKFRLPIALLALLLATPPTHAATALHKSAPRAAAGANLLDNPGFERRLPGHDWMPAGWDTSEAGVSTVFFGRDSLVAHGGHWSVNIANTSTMYVMTHNWHQTLLVDKSWWGRTVTLSVWTRSSGLDGRGFIWLQAYRDTITKMAQIWNIDREDARARMGINKVDDPAIDLGWQSNYFDDPQTDWVRREVRSVIPPGTNVLFVRLGLVGLGQVVFDDASLTFGPPAPVPVYAAGTNVLQEPGFENRGLAWQWLVPPFIGMRIDWDSTVAHGGRASMLCSHMTEGVVNTRMGLAQAVPAAGLRGKRVRISGWFKGDSLKSKAYVMLYAHSAKGVQQAPGTEMFSGTFDWSEASTEMDVPEDAQQLWAWMMVTVPCTGRVWMDDASLTVLGPASSTAQKSAPARVTGGAHKGSGHKP